MKALCIMAIIVVGNVALNSASAAFLDANDLCLYWKCDEIGMNPIAADSSGNGRTGAGSNTVSGCVNSNIKAFSGFTANNSYLCVTDALGDASDAAWGYSWSFVTWIRNPDWSSTVPHIIAEGCGGNLFGRYGDNSWSLWLDTQGRVRVGLQVQARSVTNNESEARTVAWTSNVWYQVALIFKQQDEGGVRTELAKVYVTPAGSASIGEPVVDMSYDAGTDWLYNSRDLIVGASEGGYYGDAIPSGCFKGDIRNVSVWKRLLTTDDLLADVQSFKEEWHDIDNFALLRWKMNETGTLPTAADSTTNVVDGTSFGNVVGQLSTTNAYAGFTSQSSYVGAELPISFGADYNYVARRFDLLMWVRNPTPPSGGIAVLARGSKNGYGAGGDIPWQLWVNGDGSLEVGTWDWGGGIEKRASSPFAWERGRWYQVLMRRDYSGNQTDLFSVWVTPAGVDSALGEPVVSVATTRSIIADAKHFSVGGGEDGYFSKILGGSWGGEIADVSFLSGKHYETAFLNSLLPAWYFPPRGTIVIVR